MPLTPLPDEPAQWLGYAEGDDLLEALFKVQQRFQAQVYSEVGRSIPSTIWDHEPCNGPLTPKGSEAVESALKDYAIAMSQEAAELLDWCKWKHWSNSLGNRQEVEVGSSEWLTEVRMELVDILRFLLNAMLWAGITPKTAMDLFMAKTEISRQRRLDGGR